MENVLTDTVSIFDTNPMVFDNDVFNATITSKIKHDARESINTNLFLYMKVIKPRYEKF